MNSIVQNIRNVVKNPYRILAKMIRGKAHILNDKQYLNIMYRAVFGQKINWQSPVTYNEKLQWLKVYDHNPEYSILVDKYEVKKYVTNKLGEDYVIPTLGVWNHFDEIDFDKLPDQFVLKCTHDSGGLVIVTDKQKMDKKAACKKIESSLKRNYYWKGREWPYKNVKPRIIAEQYMFDKADVNEGYDGGLRDYKIFCFSGKPQYLFIASDRNTPGREVKFDYFDTQFNKLPMRQSVHPTSTYKIKKPEAFEEMLLIAEQLSQGFTQVRIDLYVINGKIYFGEYTFFHHGGLVPFIPEKYDEIWGDLIKLPKVK